MINLQVFLPAALVALVALGGCASRPVNPPLTQVSADKGYTFQTRRNPNFQLLYSGEGYYQYDVLRDAAVREILGQVYANNVYAAAAQLYAQEGMSASSSARV
jgi:hypothetical protein